MDAACKDLSELPRVVPDEVLGIAFNRRLDNDWRRSVAGVCWATVDETTHVFVKASHVERAVLHADVDVVSPRLRVFFPLLVRQDVTGVTTVVVDRLVFDKQFDSAVYPLRHFFSPMEILARSRRLGYRWLILAHVDDYQVTISAFTRRCWQTYTLGSRSPDRRVSRSKPDQEMNPRKPSTRFRLPLYMFTLLVLAAVACTAPAAEEQDKNWTNSTDLIETSDRIMTARFTESNTETIQLVDDTNSEIIGEIEVLFRQFEIVESFKGTTDSGDSILVAFEPGRAGELVDGEGSVVKFESDETYVLFLKGRLRPIEYPSDIGGVLWTGNGEPSFAELRGDELRFVAERPYLDLLSRENQALPEPLSVAPFELTLTELQEATD